METLPMTFPRLLTLAPLTAFALLEVAGSACRSERDTQDTMRNDTGAEVARAPRKNRVRE